MHLLTLLSPNLLLFGYSRLPVETLLLRVLISLAFLALLLLMIRRTWLVILAAFPLYLAVPSVSAYLLSFGELPSISVMASVFETDLGKANEPVHGFGIVIFATLALAAANLVLTAASYSR